MATTKISPIKVTDASSLAYILDDLKTECGAFTEFFMCGHSAEEAADAFDRTRNAGTGRYRTLAQHLIQSFKPGEITPEQALEVGHALAEKFLRSEYPYVLGVHNDKAHVHVHCVFCNVNQINGKTFETNENRGKDVWKKIRALSDQICREQGLSVLDKTALSGDKGKSHYEWTQGNLSWKQKLKIAIDGAVTEAENFDDLLVRLRRAGVACVYRPDLKIRLKFRFITRDDGSLSDRSDGRSPSVASGEPVAAHASLSPATTARCRTGRTGGARPLRPASLSRRMLLPDSKSGRERGRSARRMTWRV